MVSLRRFSQHRFITEVISSGINREGSSKGDHSNGINSGTNGSEYERDHEKPFEKGQNICTLNRKCTHDRNIKVESKIPSSANLHELMVGLLLITYSIQISHFSRLSSFSNFPFKVTFHFQQVSINSKFPLLESFHNQKVESLLMESKYLLTYLHIWSLGFHNFTLYTFTFQNYTLNPFSIQSYTLNP